MIRIIVTKLSVQGGLHFLARWTNLPLQEALERIYQFSEGREGVVCVVSKIKNKDVIRHMRSSAYEQNPSDPLWEFTRNLIREYLPQEPRIARLQLLQELWEDEDHTQFLLPSNDPNKTVVLPPQKFAR